MDLNLKKKILREVYDRLLDKTFRRKSEDEGYVLKQPCDAFSGKDRCVGTIEDGKVYLVFNKIDNNNINTTFIIRCEKDFSGFAFWWNRGIRPKDMWEDREFENKPQRTASNFFSHLNISQYSRYTYWKDSDQIHLDNCPLVPL